MPPYNPHVTLVYAVLKYPVLRLLEYLVIVVFEILPLRMTCRIRREPDFTTLKLIVHFPVIELLFQPLANAEGVLRRYRHVPSVKQVMYVCTHQESIRDFVPTAFGVRYDVGSL